MIPRVRGLFRTTEPPHTRSPWRSDTDVFSFVSIPVLCGAVSGLFVLDALLRSMQSIARDFFGACSSRLVIFLFASHTLRSHSLLGFMFSYVIAGLGAFGCRLVPIPTGARGFDKAMRWRFGVLFYECICIEL